MREALRHILLENQMSHTSHPKADFKARSTSRPTTPNQQTTKKGNYNYTNQPVALWTHQTIAGGIYVGTSPFLTQASPLAAAPEVN